MKDLTKQRLNRLVYYIKQLLPLTYRSHTKQGKKRIFSVWNMWFGRCFNIEEYEILK